MIISFWISITIVVYTYLGYGIILYLLVKLREKSTKNEHRKSSQQELNLPSCSILIAAYNEESCIREKILNTLSLRYPGHLLEVFIVADGSTDRTVQIISEYPEVNLLYEPERKGKIDAVNRAMQFIHTETVVFTDANALLNTNALLHICKHYSDKNVGGVAGEKRIDISEKADASSAGENFYWKYESKLKEWDSRLNSAVGAAGELFSIRRNLYVHLDKDTILDDFIISMRIAGQGYKIVYEPQAYAVELSSSDVNEELKRKIRIAAGGMQSILILKHLLNPFKYQILSFQYISHRVLRWSITPFLLILTFISNLILVADTGNLLYITLFIVQVMFYSMAILGYLLEKKQLKFRFAFIPYYFCVMNYAVIAGIIKYFRKKQSSVWVKAKRKEKDPLNKMLVS